ncbi:transglycosylase SLT domain-containing protein [Prevotella sp. OH937_COT-195]|uniref:transglycosylase SLT domain-containing protein n=1 Tax=Prevotella sp. OH937_COT-195 TaxID=2491051 RepID=UPI000F647AF6|nr:transglycosylase SLT domain-containing protein [Prevotella sp. OH937_COT-195]RRD00848.1 tail length tape measure protein [Prevotella sp. OH937_COT-195]
MKFVCTIIFFTATLFASCSVSPTGGGLPPWGDTLSYNTALSLDDIITNGEIIAATLYGPDTYYEYRGERLGLNYLLCNNFATELGIMLRVNICRDSAELKKMLIEREADIIITPMQKKDDAEFRFCGVEEENGNRQWVVSSQSDELADAINKWYSKQGKELQVKGYAALRNSTNLISPFGVWGGSAPSGFGINDYNRKRYDEGFAETNPLKVRIKIPPMPHGALSPWDDLFKKYASLARCDWELLAAQCYQESGFNPEACSWAGACGLMQLMPQTALSLGVPRGKIFEPETNVHAAAKLMAKLSSLYSGITPFEERINFILAAYNCGAGHISDARALARRNGANGESWKDVEYYLSLLSKPKYYNDPLVRHGYVRSSETTEYVRAIIKRYHKYKGNNTSHIKETKSL